MSFTESNFQEQLTKRDQKRIEVKKNLIDKKELQRELTPALLEIAKSRKGIFPGLEGRTINLIG